MAHGKRRCYLTVCLAAIALGGGLALVSPVRTSPDAGGTPAQQDAGGTPAVHNDDFGPAAWTRNTPPKAPHVSKAGETPAAQGPAFIEIEDGKYEARTARYHATLTADGGLVYRPNGDSPQSAQRAQRKTEDEKRDTHLRVRLRSVTCGGLVVFDSALDDDAANEIAVADESGGISYWRAPGFEERYTPRGDGVEQSFLFESEPGGGGALEFVCEISTQGLVALPQRAERNGGITFVESANGEPARDAGAPSGRFAARYGQVMVRDSARRALVVEPRLEFDGSVRFAVPGEWMEEAVYPLVVDPLVGGDFLISPDNAVGVAPPTISPGNNNFLVVWNDYRAGSNLPQLAGSIVSVSGIPSSDFAISAAIGVPRDTRFQRIQAAFDGSNWLVVWPDDRAVGPGVRGAIVSSTGALLSGNDFLISPTPGTVAEDPLVAFNGVDFVVAWQNVPSGAAGGSQVYYARVTSLGVVDAERAVPSELTTVNQGLHFLAPQKPSGDTLLVYRDNGDSPAQTRSARIGVDGNLRDPGGTVLFKENLAEGGFGRPIGAAFTGTAWQVLSSFDQTLDSSIFAHTIDTAGLVTPPSGKFAEMGLGPLGSTLDQFAPAFAGAGEWLFVRNEKINSAVYHLIGKRVTFAGADLDPIPFQLDTSTQGVLRNPVAAQVGSIFLAAWLDGRRGATQPADARNIVGALVDASFAAGTGTPLVAAATASPVSGEAPLEVSFDSAASSGSYDTITWDFGDGTTSTLPQATHSYRNNGSYLAQLKLTKGAYIVYDTVLITVGGGGSTGPGGGSQVGVPVANSPGLEPRLFITSSTVTLNFVDAQKDAFRVAGVIDVGQLPDSLTGLVAGVAIGSQSFAFNLDAKGAFKSDPSVNPMLRFAMDPIKGGFVFEAVNADLRPALEALGAKNETVKPARIINVPFTVTLDKLSATATVGASYRATEGVSGTATYGFLGAGKEVSGSFVITKFASAEAVQGKTGLKVHTFSVKGQLVKPGIYKPGATGGFTFTVGNFSTTLPVGQFRLDRVVKKDDSLLGSLLGETTTGGGKLKFVGRAGVTGLKKFAIDLNSGQFNLQMLKVPAEGVGGSGMPLANSGTNITKVDLNLSFQFDLANNENFSAGRYIYIARKNAAAKGWKQR